MIRHHHHTIAILGGILWLAVCLPPVRRVLESRMTWHMLGEIPLLAACGVMLALAIPESVRRATRPWNDGGISGLLLASSFWMIWMLPIALDAAVDQPAVIAVKLLGLPLLVGIPLQLSWPLAGFMVRAIFLIEIVATLFRAGWLYMASPERLCSSYLIGDQQIAGELLLWLGAGVLLVAIGALLFGNFRPRSAEHFAAQMRNVGK